tara:strand:- start:998 stop:1243 length:246 start_codon:yes stop_codon:yes gene_type:complete
MENLNLRGLGMESSNSSDDDFIDLRDSWSRTGTDDIGFAFRDDNSARTECNPAAFRCSNSRSGFDFTVDIEDHSRGDEGAI